MKYYTTACYHEPTQILDLDGIAYFACDASNAIDFEGDLVVNFTKNPNLPGGNFHDLRDFINIGFRHELMVPWPDFGLPRIKDGFWYKLHELITRRGWTRVCFHCAMGHGRTGTALSAMLVEVAGYSPGDAIQTVRDIYCEEAVETKEQVKYLVRMYTELYGTEVDPDTLPIPAMERKVAKGRSRYGSFTV